MALGLITLLAVVTTVWSVRRDLRAYRTWRQERMVPLPRWKRRQNQKAGLDEDQDEQRWRWRILALRCAGFGFFAGATGIIVGYVTRLAWSMVAGGNLLMLSVLIWLAYQIVLPKPSALRTGGPIGKESPPRSGGLSTHARDKEP
jgi:hypothetical protein